MNVESNAVNFGIAYVDVRARLDDYDRDMDSLERRRHQSTVTLRGSGGGDGGGGFGGNGVDEFGIGTGYLIGRNRGRIMRLLNLQARFKSLTQSAGRALGRLAWPVLLLTEGGRIVEFMREIPSLAQRAIEALRNMSIKGLLVETTVWIDQMLQKVPVISHLWTGLAQTVSTISEGLGGRNWSRDLRELAEEAQRAENRMAGLAKAANLVRDAGASDSADAARRDRILSGLGGGDRIRAEGSFALEDIRDQGREAASALYQAYTEQLKILREEQDTGLIDEDQFNAQLEILTDRRIGIMQRHEQDIARAIQETRRGTAERLARHRQETERAGFEDIRRLQRGLILAQVDLEYDGADARAETIRLGYQFQIADAIRDGEAERARLLSQIAATRIAAIRRRERERWEVEMEERANGARRLRDRVRDGATELQRIELELSMPRGAERSRTLAGFDIDADANRRSTQTRRQIDELLKAREEFRESLPFGLVTNDQYAEFNAFSEQIDELQKMLDLTEELRRKRQALADQRASERGGFRQIDIRDIVSGSLARPSESGPTGNEGLRLSQLQHDELKAIRAAIENKRAGSLFN